VPTEERPYPRIENMRHASFVRRSECSPLEGVGLVCFGFSEGLRVGMFRGDFLGNCVVTCTVDGVQREDGATDATDATG
jgi:hypothetical protein